MCDYSAESVKSREAAVGDRLVTAPISQHTIGLVSPSEPGTAVCMLPGSKMTVAGIKKSIRDNFNLKDGVFIATFGQRDVSRINAFTSSLSGLYRDGVIFEGRTDVVLFKDLDTGVEMSVETIPGVSDEPPPPAAVATEHSPTVNINDLVGV
jgi:hypothetical protein